MATDGIFHVIRAFDDPEVGHVDDEIDPVRDLETITAELCLKDMETVKRAIADEDARRRGREASGRRAWTRARALTLADGERRNERWEEDAAVT